MNPNKTVSVVMCTFNGERYVREQLDSIVAQTYPIHELIIEDDGSTDRTVEICREYASRYPFIRVVVNERNLGLDANFEAATMRSTGDFVALSDQDDVWYPEKISRQVAAIGDTTFVSLAMTVAPTASIRPLSASNTALRPFSSPDSRAIPCCCVAISRARMSIGRWPARCRSCIMIGASPSSRS